MIVTSVSFQNFFSFKNKETMNFCVNEKTTLGDHLGVYNNNHHFSKVSSIFGANGSGKTKLINVFSFLRSFIAESFSYPDNEIARLWPFKTTKTKPSIFETEFYIDNVFYKWHLECNSERVLSETLESRKNKRLTKLYSRQYNSANNSYTLEASNINLENSFIDRVRPNASIISTGRQYNHLELSKIRNHWLSVKQFSDQPRRSDLENFLEASKFYCEHKNYFQEAKEFLKEADLGLRDIQITPTTHLDLKTKKYLSLPYGIHKSQGQEFKLPFGFESGGTLHLYAMLSVILPALKEGSLCVIDEIEKHLHPNILPSIMNLFIFKDTNPTQAQLICTTHTPTLMSELHKYQIFLVEKNPECESEVYRLDEVKGIRNDDNLMKKYLAGTYGGVPDVDM